MALLTHVREAVAGHTDVGAAELARTYASAIDAGDRNDLARLGPLLLAVLESMALTTRARAAVMKGAKDEQRPKSPLDELRERRDARKRHTKAVDAAGP